MLVDTLHPMKTLRELLGRDGHAAEEPEAAPPERCLACNADLRGSRSYERYRVCHSCGFHFHLNARERVATILDVGSFKEQDRGITSIDPLSFRGRQSYRRQVIDAQRRTGLSEAALSGRGTLFGREVAIAVTDFSFLGGSIGVAAGERLARAFERAAARRIPMITVCSTAGTRMHEGLLALMQMPRVLAALDTFEQQGLPHVAVLTDPTTGSAFAGFVNRADFLIAEPNALIGYAALRSMQEREGAALPNEAHTSQWHLERGLIDAVVPRPQLRDYLATLLDLLLSEQRLFTVREAKRRPAKHSPVEAWQQVQLSRHEERPTSRDFIGRMATSFIEIRGDRMGDDDMSIAAGFAEIGGEPVVVIGQVRQHGDEGDGWVHAAGFRKATRAMRLAARFNLPLLTLIDTPGASPSLADEEAGLGHAIAECMATMLWLPSPTVAVIIGEGGSEAALAMAVADRVLMLDNAVYEVIRPEDAARIIYQEASRAGEVAERLRITSHDCMRLGVIDDVIPEPGDGAHTDHAEAARLTQRSVLRTMATIQRQNGRRRLRRRLERYRQIGSTHSALRGTLERRLAHVFDRMGGAWERVRHRGRALLRSETEGEDIPI